MPPTRLPASERRRSILPAASAIFARYGFEGARTQQIARAAGVSEALIFRHFASRQVLYRAALRQIVREQNENFAAFGEVEPSARGLLTMIERMIDQAIVGGGAKGCASWSAAWSVMRSIRAWATGAPSRPPCPRWRKRSDLRASTVILPGSRRQPPISRPWSNRLR